MSRRELCVLFSSAGRRVELIQCFRAAAARLDVTLRVMACDRRPELSAACHTADRAFAVPGCDDEAFIDAVADICRTENVDLVVPTIDPELLPFSLNAERFAERGTRIHVSPPLVVEIARDKLRTMHTFHRAGLAVPRTDTLENARQTTADWTWPVFVKPRSGSASRSISVIHDPNALPKDCAEPMIVQEYLSGPNTRSTCSSTVMASPDHASHTNGSRCGRAKSRRGEPCAWRSFPRLRGGWLRHCPTHAAPSAFRQSPM